MSRHDSVLFYHQKHLYHISSKVTVIYIHNLHRRSANIYVFTHTYICPAFVKCSFWAAYWIASIPNMIYIFISHPWVWFHCWIFIAVSMHLVVIYWCGGGSSAERQKQGSFSETEFSDCTYEFCIHPAQYVENTLLNNYRLYENELTCMKFSALVEQSQFFFVIPRPWPQYSQQ